jgi:AcrR family transcriptional regulator
LRTVIEISDTPPSRSDARANRAILMDTAVRLYGERGLDVTSDEIAKGSGVGRATFYRHFPSRDALWMALLNRMFEQGDEVVRSLADSPERFFDLFEAWIRIQADNMSIIELTSPTWSDEYLKDLNDRFDSVFRESLNDAKSAGLVPADISLRDVRVLVMMIGSLNRRSASEADRARATEFALTLLGRRSISG